MLTDIVIDTNVLLHAHNQQEVRHRASRELLIEMQNCATQLCVDEGFDLVESRNRSQIASEYLRHLRHGMLGLAVVAHLAASRRVKQVPRKAPPAFSRAVRRQIANGPDRVFVFVAFNSNDKTLACHDFDDVPDTVRGRLRPLGVNIVDAENALAALR